MQPASAIRHLSLFSSTGLVPESTFFLSSIGLIGCRTAQYEKNTKVGSSIRTKRSSVGAAQKVVQCSSEGRSVARSEVCSVAQLGCSVVQKDATWLSRVVGRASVAQ